MAWQAIPSHNPSGAPATMTVYERAGPANVRDYMSTLLVHLTFHFPPASPGWSTAMHIATVDRLCEAELRQLFALFALPPTLARARSRRSASSRSAPAAPGRPPGTTRAKASGG
ncbi:uncharacterized protein BXZ73DRAFT_104907 [Epithele typhae]|uniref:uncharacterized protein n=1 Tax=Epithele typhae TaxID=378194 RepID=UPI0020076465|nr:uncharacterized protein BXZ73DRAFT_104907 [Epithele typhae]KAH9919799.1 hypothetical protein BXZ73DRAFT_104907 [Epithele typhae]